MLLQHDPRESFFVFLEDDCEKVLSTLVHFIFFDCLSGNENTDGHKTTWWKFLVILVSTGDWFLTYLLY